MTTAQALEPRKLAREYLRVSIDRSGRAKSVEEQHADHEQDAAREGWTLGQPYDDLGSASRHARKPRGNFAALLADLTSGEFGAEILVIWESSRGSRQVGEWVTLLDLCEAAGVRIWIHTHATLYDPSNPRHRRTLLEDAVDSEYEVAKSRARWRRGIDASARAGLPHGRLLYGYERVYDGSGKFVEQRPHPEQAPVVREIAERVAAGQSCYEISRDLNARGIRRPRNGRSQTFAWDLTQVKRVVMNPTYAGYRVHQGKIVARGVWEPLISEDTWQACVARLSDPRRRTIRDAKVKHLLTGTAKCGLCDHPLRILKQRTGYLAYMCHPGFHVAIKKDWLDEFVTELVLARMEREDAMELLVPPDQEQATAAARREVAELEERLAGFYRQGAAGKLSPEGLAVIEAELLPQIEEAKNRARPAVVPAALRQLAGPRAREVWISEEFSIGLQRETVALLLEVRLMPTRRGTRTFQPERVQWEWKRSAVD